MSTGHDYQIDIPDDWDGESYCLLTMCVPESVKWRSIVSGMLSALEYGRTYDARTGSIKIAQTIGAEVISSMAVTCGQVSEDIAGTLQEILQKLDQIQSESVDMGCTVNVNCGCSSSESPVSGCINSTGSQGTGQEDSPASPEIIDGNTVPPGFTDGPAYLEYKCNMAQQIINEIKADNLQWSSWVTAENTITGLVSLVAGSLLTPIPGDELVALASLSLTASLLYIDFFGNTTTVLNNAEQALLCALYEGCTVSDAQTQFKQAIEAEAAVFGTIQEALIVVWLNSYATQDSFNRLVQSTALTVTNADCTNCSPPGVGVYFTLGINGQNRGVGSTVGDGSLRTITAVQDSNNLYYIQMGVYAGPGDSQTYANDCSPLPAGVSGTNEERFIINFVTGTRIQDSGTLGTRCDSGVHTVPFNVNANVGYGTPQELTWYEFISTDPFTLDMTIEHPLP